MSRIAIFHDNFAQMGGAERVADTLAGAFPGSTLHTTLAAHAKLIPALRAREIQTTWMQRLPEPGRYYRHYFMLYPFAIEGVDLQRYDLIVTSCFGYAKGVRKRRDALVESFGRAGWDIPPPDASMFAWAPLPAAFRELGSMQFATLMVEKSGVVVSPGVAFGEHGEGYVRIAMVENEQRIRQAARGVRRFLESGIETLHNVVPLANRR